MKNYLIFLPVTLIYLSLKSTLASSLPIPEITVMITLFIAYEKTSLQGLILVFILGYIDDVFTGSVIGSSSFALVLIYVVVGLMSRKVELSTVTTRAGVAAALTLLKMITVWIIIRATGLPVPFMAQIIFTVIVTGLFAPVIIAAFMWLKRLAGSSAQSEREDSL
jgi:rod shape-determining protein MreD